MQILRNLQIMYRKLWTKEKKNFRIFSLEVMIKTSFVCTFKRQMLKLSTREYIKLVR